MEEIDKQKQFVEEYLIDLNATQAYKKAYNIESDDVAAASGSRLLRNVKVQEYLTKRFRELRKSTDITPERVIEELAKIGFAQYPDFVQIIEKVKNGKKSQSVEVRDFAFLTEDQKCAIAKIKYSQKGIEIVLYDKIKALELIGKHIGMFKDEIKLEGLADSDWFVIHDDEKKEDDRSDPP